MEKFFEKLKEEIIAPEARVVGNASEEVKKDFQEKYKEYLYDENIINMSREELEMIKFIECEKRMEEIQLIKAADDELNKIMEELGVKSFNVPQGNVHIFDSELYEEKKLRQMGIRGSAGFYNVKERFVGVPSNRRDNLFDFGAVIFHELNHLKGHHTFKVDKIDTTKIEEEKNENQIEAEDDKSILYLVKKSLGLIRKARIESKKSEKRPDEVFEKWEQDELKKALKESGKTPIEKEADIKIDIYRSGLRVLVTEEKKARLEKQGEDEIKHGYFSFLDEAVVAEMEGIYRKKLGDNPIIKKYLEDVRQTEGELSAEFKIDRSGGYPGPRDALKMLVSGIYENNQDKFKSEDEVFNIFSKARFTGHLLPMSRLIINTFGKDIFEKAANMSYSASEVIDALKIIELRKKLENL